jgi:hypothetical protein
MPVYNHVAGSFIQTIPAPTGVYIKSLSMASSVIDGNNFNPTSVSSGVFPTQYGIYGDYAAFSGGLSYVASNNVFQYITVGISDKGGDFASSSITGNQFYNNEKGFELRHGNSTPSNPALFQIKCNDFVKDQNTAGTQTYGIYLSHGAVLNAQGSCPNPFLPPTTSTMSNNEFLSDGYPLQYLNNGTLSVFAPGYDFVNDFYAIANVNSTPLVYKAASNENLGLSPTMQYSGVNVSICLDGNFDPLPSNTQTCPTFSGVANKSIKLKSKEIQKLSIFPNPSNGSFTIICTECTQIESVEVTNLLGEIVAIFLGKSENKELDIELSSTDLSNGLYNLRIIDESGLVMRSSIMLKR